MSANAALKEQTYTVDAGDPVTTAGVAIIRTQKTGVLAEAFGRPEVARHKVAEKLKALGHQYDIDAMCLEALERYIEEHGEVPNATKVKASAQILDRLPDPQFDSGHRVVFAINEDGTDFIGASEMGLAISPSGTTTTSRSGKVDERFGAITKETLWIMIDFPEKSELDAIELEQGQALAAVAEAIADPATAVENLDAIIAQVQELGEITDMSPTDVAATIETIANAIEAHNTATEAMTLVETGAASPDSPAVQKMNEKVEALSQQITEQLCAQDSALPPVIAETIQAVMETVQPPQTAPAQTQATVETPATVVADIEVGTPQTSALEVNTVTATDVSAPSANTPAIGDVAMAIPQASVSEIMAEAPQTSVAEVAAVTSTDNSLSNAEPVAQQQEQAASQTIQTITADQPSVTDSQTVEGADVSIGAQTQQTPSLAEVVAQAPVSLKNDATVITPQAFERVQPAAIAAQVTAIAAQLPAALNTAQAQTALKQVASAIKNDHHVPAVLQSKVESVIAKMPEGPAKLELARVVETVKAKQEARKEERKPTPAPTHTPIIIRQAFANPAPATPPTPTQPRPVPSPRNDNIVGGPAQPNPTTGHSPAPVTPKPAPTGGHGPAPVTPSHPQPIPTEGQGPDQPGPTHRDGPRDTGPTVIEGYRPPVAPEHIVPVTPELRETVIPTNPKIVVTTPDGPEDKIPTNDPSFEQPVKRCGGCPKAGACSGAFCGAVETNQEKIAEQRNVRSARLQQKFG